MDLLDIANSPVHHKPHKSNFYRLARLVFYCFLFCDFLIPLNSYTNEKNRDNNHDDEGQETEENQKPPITFWRQNVYWHLIRQYLGGLEVEYTRGEAQVSSYIVENNRKKKVASGKASQQGWKIAFNSPEYDDNFFLRLSPNYFQQTITIKDFRRSLPKASLDSSQPLETVVSDFNSGALVDPLDPNAFLINLKSSGLEFLSGGTLTLFENHNEDFFTLDLILGISLAEYRNSQIDIGSDRRQDTNFTFLDAWRYGLALNFIMLPIHSSIRFSYFAQYYRDFQFPKQMEFRDSDVSYNPEIQAFERKRVFVKGFSLRHQTWRFAYFLTF